jgi:hypothetical protein
MVQGSAIAETTHGVEVGTIFDSHWGYDQSNVDWFEVVGVTKTGVQIREVASAMAEDGRHVVPVPGLYVGAKRFVKVHTYDEGRTKWINLTSYSGASVWDGSAKYDTLAAGEMGH